MLSDRTHAARPPSRNWVEAPTATGGDLVIKAAGSLPPGFENPEPWELHIWQI